MPTTWSVPPRVLADAVDLRELVRLGQVNDALSGKADAGHTHGLPAHAATHATGGGDALTAGDVGAVPTSQRGPVGGVNAQTLSANTYNLDASTFNVRRYTLTGDITLNVPTNGVDGQRITFWFGASGAQRTVTFASGYEVSPLLPSRVIVIASGTWEMVEVECRGGTWRLVQTDQLLFAPADIGAATAVHAARHAPGAADPLMGSSLSGQASNTVTGTTNGNTNATTTYVAVGNTGVVFVAPPSGSVLIEASSALVSGSANAGALAAPQVRTGTTVGSGTIVLTAADANAVSNYSTSTLDASRSTLLTGLTPGASYNAQLMLRSGSTATATSARQRVLVVPLAA